MSTHATTEDGSMGADAESLPSEWERLSEAEKSRRVRETSDLDPDDVVETNGRGEPKEQVDPTDLDWRRVWDDHDLWDGAYPPLGETKLTAMLECCHEMVTAMDEAAAVRAAFKAGRLVRIRRQYVPAEAYAGGTGDG